MRRLLGQCEEIVAIAGDQHVVAFACELEHGLIGHRRGHHFPQPDDLVTQRVQGEEHVPPAVAEVS